MTSNCKKSILREKTVSIVRDSSALMKRRDFWVKNKGDKGNDVTAMDVAVQEYLKKHLLEILPGSVFMGEEDEFIWDEKRVNATEWLWIVDPIDGTSNFIRNLQASAISVGLLHNGIPWLGVVYNPYLDEMHEAEKDCGAFLNGQPIHVSDRDFSHGHFCTAASLYDKSLAKPCFSIMEEVYGQCDDFRRFGTAAIEMSSLAAGRTELYFEMRLFPWDYTASVVLIQEAGGYVGTLPSLSGIVYHRPIPIIAANTEESFQRLCKIIDRHIPELPY